MFMFKLQSMPTKETIETGSSILKSKGHTPLGPYINSITKVEIKYDKRSYLLCW